MALDALLAELLAVVAVLSPLLEVVRTLPRTALLEELVCCVVRFCEAEVAAVVERAAEVLAGAEVALVLAADVPVVTEVFFPLVPVVAVVDLLAVVPLEALLRLEELEEDVVVVLRRAAPEVEADEDIVAEELLLGVAEALEEELREELAADLFCEELAEVVDVLRLA